VYDVCLVGVFGGCVRVCLCKMCFFIYSSCQLGLVMSSPLLEEREAPEETRFPLCGDGGGDIAGVFCECVVFPCLEVECVFCTLALLWGLCASFLCFVSFCVVRFDCDM